MLGLAGLLSAVYAAGMLPWSRRRSGQLSWLAAALGMATVITVSASSGGASVASTGASAAAVAPAPGDLPEGAVVTTKTLSVAAATRAAEAALRSCVQAGNVVTVAVVERSGMTRVLLRGDGAAEHTDDSAVRKAYTSAAFGQPTSAC